MHKLLTLLALSLAMVVAIPAPLLAAPLGGDELKSLYEDSVYYDLSEAAASCVEPGDTDTITLTGGDNLEKGYNYFIDKGLTAQQSAAIIGNFMQESHMNPSAQQDGSTDKFPKDGVGFGIAQWTYEVRQRPLVNLAEQKGQPVTSLAVQLDYVWQELNGDYKQVLQNLKNQSTIEDAVLYFMGTSSSGGTISGYENPGDPYLERRIDYAKAVLSKYGGASSGGGADPADPPDPCSDGVGGLGINGDFVFPLKTTQAAIKNVNGTVPWCYQSQDNCHHDYAAADIFERVGTSVVAAVSGQVVSLTSPASCDGWRGVPRMQIKGSDGTYYYYTHMRPGSLRVKQGQTVKAGDTLGQIGATECAQGTAPHLHFQMSKVMVSNTESATERKQYINPQPNLVAAFAKLPES